MRRLLLAAIALALSVSFTYGQTSLCFTTNGENCVKVSPLTPLPTTVIGAGLLNILATSNVGYPERVIPLVFSASGTTSAVTVEFPAIGTNYLCGFSIDSVASTAKKGLIVITGFGNNLSYIQSVGSGQNVGSLHRTFNPCLAAIFNTSVVIKSIAAGTGGITTINAWGYRF